MSVINFNNGRVEETDDSFKVEISLGNDVLKPETHIKETYQLDSWGLADKGCDGPNAMYVGLLANDEGIIQIKASNVMRVKLTPPKPGLVTSDDSVH